MHTDASIEGLGAVLEQEQEDGKLHPIAYASRSLSKAERNYGITEMEALGVVWGAKHFRAYLYGHKCIVYTDHSPLRSMLNAQHPSGKLARWSQSLCEFDLELRYRPGRVNSNADALSRAVTIMRMMMVRLRELRCQLRLTHPNPPARLQSCRWLMWRLGRC